MANPEHLEVLNQGVEVWNRWRGEQWGGQTRPDLSEADLSGLNLTDVNFLDSELSGTNLNGTNLFRAGLIRANLEQASLIETDLSETYLEQANLQGANLFRAKLDKADLNSAALIGANLSEVSLVKTYFLEASLCEANLVGAKFYSTNFSVADLSDTNLRGVEFWRVNFTQSTLQNADFEGSAMIFSTFAGVDLRTVKGLNTVTHLGPTYIDTNTLTQFNGDIPESFLRGCGLSDLQIETAKLYNPRLTSKETSTIIDRIQQLFPAQYHSCFISYSSKDKAFAQRLHADLQQNGVRCWFAPKDMRMGDRIRSTIDQSIRTHDKLMVILSENSINSEWVETEVETAFEEERKRKQTVLFPVRLDVAVMETEQAWAANIRTRHIGDFSRWKDHNEYQQAFERLLKDLKAEN